jgi:hypothetical protein
VQFRSARTECQRLALEDALETALLRVYATQEKPVKRVPLPPQKTKVQPTLADNSIATVGAALLLFEVVLPERDQITSINGPSFMKLWSDE